MLLGSLQDCPGRGFPRDQASLEILMLLSLVHCGQQEMGLALVTIQGREDPSGTLEPEQGPQEGPICTLRELEENPPARWDCVRVILCY